MQDKHFMTDKKLINHIISVSDVKVNETVLEIGAGRGELTREIAKRAGKVIAVEIDKTFQKHLKDIPNTEIIFENALTVLKNQKIRFDKIISNLPYSISEPLIWLLIKKDFKSGVLTVPKKFAYRLVAKPGDELYSKLSVVAQVFFNIKIMQEVPKSAFHPKPKTNSVIIKIIPKPKNLSALVLLKQGMKVKNAVREALCASKGLTKREARKIIKRLNINKLLDKKTTELKKKDIETIISCLKPEELC
ncbi:MAG: hypothetical protein DRP13_01585 [Candidatus Aenigmatarchaeota archaeon]|nr:MAG: hypothetical protein DRP13_01585 [Candidatus Aenigmarchaeota archaeon]